jgi:nicotinamidase-related amidase
MSRVFSGCKVVWVQTTSVGALEHWSSEGFRLYPALESLPEVIRVTKIKYSAMIPHSSNLGSVLAENGIDTLQIAGTKTSVCANRRRATLDARISHGHGFRLQRHLER